MDITKVFALMIVIVAWKADNSWHFILIFRVGAYQFWLDKDF